MKMMRLMMPACLMLLVGCAHYEGTTIPAALIHLDEGSEPATIRVSGKFGDANCDSSFLEQRLGPGQLLRTSARHERMTAIIADDYIASLNVCLDQNGRRLPGLTTTTRTRSPDTLSIRCKVPPADSIPPDFDAKRVVRKTGSWKEGLCTILNAAPLEFESGNSATAGWSSPALESKVSPTSSK
jgi:hypothetical protein